MQVVLGNETTENSLVHDVKVLKSDVEMDKEQIGSWLAEMDSMKAASDQLKEEVETVRKRRVRRESKETEDRKEIEDRKVKVDR